MKKKKETNEKNTHKNTKLQSQEKKSVSFKRHFYSSIIGDIVNISLQ